MAIQKTKVLPSGIEGNYWRLLNMNFNRQTMQATAIIALFKDKAASDAGKPNIGYEKTFQWTFSPSDLAGNINVVAAIYNKIKITSETEVTKDSIGRLLLNPKPFDEDLANGETA